MREAKATRGTDKGKGKDKKKQEQRRGHCNRFGRTRGKPLDAEPAIPQVASTLAFKDEVCTGEGIETQHVVDGPRSGEDKQLDAEAIELSKLEAEVRDRRNFFDAARIAVRCVSNELRSQMTRELAPLLSVCI